MGEKNDHLSIIVRLYTKILNRGIAIKYQEKEWKIRK